MFEHAAMTLAAWRKQADLEAFKRFNFRGRLLTRGVEYQLTDTVHILIAEQIVHLWDEDKELKLELSHSGTRVDIEQALVELDETCFEHGIIIPILLAC